jgi:hypothetical protein
MDFVEFWDENKTFCFIAEALPNGILITRKDAKFKAFLDEEELRKELVEDFMSMSKTLEYFMKFIRFIRFIRFIIDNPEDQVNFIAYSHEDDYHLLEINACREEYEDEDRIDIELHKSAVKN